MAYSDIFHYRSVYKFAFMMLGSWAIFFSLHCCCWDLEPEWEWSLSPGKYPPPWSHKLLFQAGLQFSPNDTHDCFIFSHWLTLCTIKDFICLLTFWMWFYIHSAYPFGGKV